jgi:hypothetical protein
MILVGRANGIKTGLLMSMTWFPCYLLPNEIFGNDRWDIAPGLSAGPMSDSERTLWKGAFGNLPYKESFEPNFLVQMNDDEFIEGIIERLSARGYDRRELSKDIPPEFGARIPLLPDEPLRWVLISLSLCRTFDIKTPAARYHFREGDSPGQLIGSGCVATHAGHERSFYTQVSHHPSPSEHIDNVFLDKIAETIEIYFQPIGWRVDPVSVALSCFWAFLFSSFADQAYTSLVTILEALLSTGSAEISHQISERVAVLIGQSPSERLEIYRKIKKLYDLRSRITHGDLKLKNGPITWDSTIVSARMTIVSIPMLEELAQYSTKVLRAVLEDGQLMSVMSKKQDDRRKALDEFFLRRLFS